MSFCIAEGTGGVLCVELAVSEGWGCRAPRFHCRRHIPGSALIRHRAVEDKESVSGGVHSRPMINPAPIISGLQTLTDAEERRGPARLTDTCVTESRGMWESVFTW